ncbi:ataxia telangiectasia mutated [Phlyctema vagabunda]|uniref:Serine/threonine-protein kinase TEL1 n=1 Tax=Phlyctema vagabunda TaxID=108571 RepID=A0ABR4PIU8_9HELO
MWLQHSDKKLANKAVAKYIKLVPSRKFATLMNQLTSRLLDNKHEFQEILYDLAIQICTDHPYHGMYQIFAGINTRANQKDEAALSRLRAMKRIDIQLQQIQKVSTIWSSIHSTNKAYCRLAAEKDDAYKGGRKIALKDSPTGTALRHMISKCHIPPPTMQIVIAVDLDYSKVPYMTTLEPQISIASGVSAPKIITAIASDGQKYRQLVKGGNDDLRQDAIMEQVFAQVSELLKANRSSRQRNLSIRTYKVLPLTTTAGVIEFVPNTMPLHDYLMPAHERYFPKDLKGNQCRRVITDAQAKSLDSRVSAYRSVTEKFHPVMRYFFTERFDDPDEWFMKRLAYTRSTAAISILGHVLGLGDRHGHNILLDADSGEVVHIDLGVAFEMGRVLPVPELVPFRLTRDIVDGMGITKTEGVFRRCCEFTLEALRKEVYSISTILDVLRYDPLYSWSISPVRLAKLQDAESAGPEAALTGENERAREVVNEPGEADRALTVVNKKLSKTLSVTATVNDLINQATDERNLAVLYSGWAAYA